jgi:hypothetical protein
LGRDKLKAIAVKLGRELLTIADGEVWYCCFRLVKRPRPRSRLRLVKEFK